MDGVTGFCEVTSCCEGNKVVAKKCMDYPANTKVTVTVDYRFICFFQCCFSSNKCAAACKGGGCGANVKELACKILAMYEEKKIGLKPDHFDSRGNSPYDGAAALSQIRDTCYGNKVSKYLLNQGLVLQLS